MASVNDPNDTRGRLIAADQVEGTSIYNRKGESLGSVEDVMIDKVSGRIAYAVAGFGGFLGIGNRHYPLPWDKLKYDTQMGGYVVDIDRRSVGRRAIIQRYRDRRLAGSRVGPAGLRLLRRHAVFRHAVISLSDLLSARGGRIAPDLNRRIWPLAAEPIRHSSAHRRRWKYAGPPRRCR